MNIAVFVDMELRAGQAHVLIACLAVVSRVWHCLVDWDDLVALLVLGDVSGADIQLL